MQETQETQVRSLGREDPLEWEMTTHSSLLAWEIPWTEKPGWIQSMKLQKKKKKKKVDYDLAIKQQQQWTFTDHTFLPLPFYDS